MTQAASGNEHTSHYALKPRNPVRAWAIAACLLIAGVVALWTGLAGEAANVALVVTGAVLAVAGLGLGIPAPTFVSNRTLYVVLSPDGFEVSGPGYHKSGAWIDVDSVSATPDGARLVIGQGHIERTFIQAPGSVADDQMKALTADISSRVRAARG